MQSQLTDIMDIVWDLADLALEYGNKRSEPDLPEQVFELCGLVCRFADRDITRLTARDIDLALLWRSFETANDNGEKSGPCGLFASEIFPESATFLNGSVEVLEKWHSELLPLRGALVA